MKLQLNGWIILDPLQGWHLLLAIDVYDRLVRLIDAKKEVDHALAERVLEIVVVVATHGCDQLWN